MSDLTFVEYIGSCYMHFSIKNLRTHCFIIIIYTPARYTLYIYTLRRGVLYKILFRFYLQCPLLAVWFCVISNRKVHTIQSTIVGNTTQKKKHRNIIMEYKVWEVGFVSLLHCPFLKMTNVWLWTPDIKKKLRIKSYWKDIEN